MDVNAPAQGKTGVSSTAISFVDWGAVLAGAVLAAALSFVLLTFGATIGLSAASPWPNSGLSSKFIAALAVFWTFVQQIGAFMAGGYVAGRMRDRWHDPSVDEVEFRDGLHGGLVWAVGVVIGAALLMATAGAVGRTGAQIAGNAAGLAAASANNPMDGIVDTLLRPASQAAAGGAQPAGGAAAPSRASPQGTPEDARGEIVRLLASSLASGSLIPNDRTYLIQIISQRSGIPPAEAERRMNDAVNAARAAADTARRSAVLTGFVTAAALILSLGAAWWAGITGGAHRDNAVPAQFVFGQRPARSV